MSVKESQGSALDRGLEAGMQFDLNGKRVWVAGHRGMVGSALVRRLQNEGGTILTCGKDEANLERQADVEAWLGKSKPDVIFLAAARVGGILANDTYAADFIYNNIIIQANVIQAAHLQGVEKLILLGSSCIYPKFAPQPIREEALLTGPLEPTNEWYAIAKIAGIKMGQAYRRQYGSDFISVMPTNLYGPGDNFDLTSSHVLPALIRKAHQAKATQASTLTIWGTGSPRREFLHVDDCADAIVHVAKTYSEAEHVNIGSGEDISIYDLTKLVAKIVGFDGEIVRDETKPDGTPRKLMGNDKLRAMGWKPTISLEQGIERTYRWFLEHVAVSAHA